MFVEISSYLKRTRLARSKVSVLRLAVLGWQVLENILHQSETKLSAATYSEGSNIWFFSTGDGALGRCSEGKGWRTWWRWSDEKVWEEEQERVHYSVSVSLHPHLSCSQWRLPLCRPSAYRNLCPARLVRLYACVRAHAVLGARVVVMVTLDHLPCKGVFSEVDVQRVEVCCFQWEMCGGITSPPPHLTGADEHLECLTSFLVRTKFHSVLFSSLQFRCYALFFKQIWNLCPLESVGKNIAVYTTNM